MKKPYIITYAFSGDAKRYSGLYDAIKGYPGWWHYIDNTWLILAECDANSIYKTLEPHVDKDINLLIIEVGKDRQGLLPKKAWEWFKRNIPK